MKTAITHEFLFDRIHENPLEQLGGYSPANIHPYFAGYEHARSYHGWAEMNGQLSMSKFSEWFTETIYGGSQGFAAYCSQCVLVPQCTSGIVDG